LRSSLGELLSKANKGQVSIEGCDFTPVVSRQTAFDSRQPKPQRCRGM